MHQLKPIDRLVQHQAPAPAPVTALQRSDHMVALYGEVCKRTQAGRILNRDPKTIRAMVEDGRLQAACEGTMIDVRSIADYIMAPEENDRIARLDKRRERDGINCRFSV